MDIVNARSDYGATGDGTTDDTVALQDAINACFGSPSSPHGINYALNKILFIPNGKYKISGDGLLLTKLQGAKIYGSGRFTTTIENVTPGGAVFRSNGMGYSSISDMQLQCHTGGQCIDLDWDGTAGGAALQANSFRNLMCYGSYEANTVGVRVGQSGFMGSECIFMMYHTQGCAIGTLINNFNALQHQFYGGQDQADGVGIWCTVGSAPVINGRAFQVQSECDIRTSGGLHNAMNVTGCRSESRNFIHNDGGQYLDVSACMQLYPGTDVGDFVSSAGGYVTIRNCEATGKVRPYYWTRLILENCQTSLELDLGMLWWIPHNTVAANILIRNCWIVNEDVMVDDQRRFTTNGQTITTIDLSSPGGSGTPGPQGPPGPAGPPGSSTLPPDPSLPPTTVRWAVTDNEGNQMVAFYLPGPNGPIVIGGGSAVTYTTLNPADKSAKVTLSNGNLTAEINANTTNGESVRSIASHASGDYYCEVTIDEANGTDNLAFGPCNATFNVTNTAFSTVNAAGYFSDGNIYGNTGGGSVLNTGVTYANGDVIGCEVNKTGSQYRVRKNGGSWSLWADCSFITGDWYFGCYVFKNVFNTLTAKETANFGATAYQTAAPAGSHNWGDPGGSAATTFDPANKSANLALSGGDLVATSTSGSLGTNQAVRSTANHSTGKYYCEFTLTNEATPPADANAIGVCNASYVIDGAGGYFGVNVYAIGYYDDSGVYFNNSAICQPGPYTTSDVLCMAVDATARLVWFLKPGGAWNNDGSANPATGVGGIDISAMTGSLFAAVEAQPTGSVWTANFGATAYSQTPPSGFGNW